MRLRLLELALRGQGLFFEVRGLQVLFPLQNLLRKIRAGTSALPEIEEPIRAELFSSERLELSLYKVRV